MGFLDELKNKLPFGQAGAYPEDDYGAEEATTMPIMMMRQKAAIQMIPMAPALMVRRDSYGYDDEPVTGFLARRVVARLSL